MTPTRSAAPNREPSSPASALLVSMGMDAHATVWDHEANKAPVENDGARCRSSLQSFLLACHCCPFEHRFELFV